MKALNEVTIYTDGACSGNPGPGGWAAILLYNSHEKVISGSHENTTNNRMELTAIIEALKCLKVSCRVNVFSDSEYVVRAFNEGWLEKWKSNGWITAGKREVKNRDLWDNLIQYMKMHEIRYWKVKGHSGDEFNIRCDKLARESIKKIVGKNGKIESISV